MSTHHRFAMRVQLVSVGLLFCLAMAGCGAKSERSASQEESRTATMQELDYAEYEAADSEAADSAAEDETFSEENGAFADDSQRGPGSPHDSAIHGAPYRSSEPAKKLSVVKPKSAEVQSDKLAIELGNIVEVYYATDRLPTAELMPGVLRVFAPTLVVCMLCCATFIGLSAARRFQAAWVVSAGLAVCACLIVFHSSIIRWQQYSTLANDASTRYSAARFESVDRYPLHVGTARVSLPKLHQPGHVESPSLLRLEFAESVDKHVVLQSVTVADSADTWFEGLSAKAVESPEQECFVFLHGYNVRFADAVKRTAQLWKDLRLQGPAICYSWPSRGSIAGYTADEAAVSWTAPHLEELLTDIRSRTQCRTINVLAHSMGNRALLQAIERLHLRRQNVDGGIAANKPPLMENLVMAAPDVDASEFESRYLRAVKSVFARCTLYVSHDDRPLQVSAALHGADRLGLNVSLLSHCEGIDTIDVGDQDFLSLGHSYYGSDASVLDDIRAVFHSSSPPSQRSALSQIVDTVGGSYWQLKR
ncbi:MAG: alpha/beta hydrolase [Planctomycetales bacterium]|nr:alpha/beta hydrolase [Planctomycetales bacterium]